MIYKQSEMGYFSKLDNGDDEPLTPVGRLFSQPSFYQVMHISVTTANPINVAQLKAELASSAFTSLPRFTSLLYLHPKTSREYWRKTDPVNVDDHVMLIDDKCISDVNDYLADLAVSCPLRTDKPLWEVHILEAHNCIVFRIHHALADGISFMSLLQSSSSNSQQTAKSKTPVGLQKYKKQKSIFDMVKMVWFTFIYIFEFVLRCLWVKDGETVLTARAGLELWPRKLATASFSMEDMKIVKNSVIPYATINDVMLGVLSAGLSAYMHLHSPNVVQEGRTITAATMVNLRPVTSGIPEMSDLVEGDSRTGWGNKISFMLHPISIRKPSEADPLQPLRAAKASMDKKKLSKVARLTHTLGNFSEKIFGPKFATWMLYNLGCNTAFLVSNIMGPSQDIYMVGNRVISIKMSVSSSPQALTMHMVSYSGKALMQILAAKDIIPDPEVLAKCFENALQNMKKEATSSKPNQKRS